MSKPFFTNVSTCETFVSYISHAMYRKNPGYTPSDNAKTYGDYLKLAVGN